MTDPGNQEEGLAMQVQRIAEVLIRFACIASASVGR